MAKRSLVLGVDGGNTKSLVVVSDLDGRVVGTGSAGCGDIYGSTAAAALLELDAAIDAALLEAGTSGDAIVAAGFSLAGADWPEDLTFLEHEMGRRVASEARIVVVNDAMGALRAGSPDGDGVAVVCGTGSAIGARFGRESWHTSFWGEDAGALAIGRRALRALVRADLGLDAEVDFAREALKLLEVTTVSEMLHKATRRGAPRTMLAALAPVVLGAAERGDAVASRLVARSARILGEYARVAAGKVGLTKGPYPLVFAGGVFRHSGPLLRSVIAAALPQAQPTDARLPPVVGALLLGFDRLGVRPDPGLIAGTLPAIAGFVVAARDGRVNLDGAPAKAAIP